ncbi:hypothetical protein COO60DRAFT_1482691, partial [Scenedesmus sp. NREL 46B-D3]
MYTCMLSTRCLLSLKARQAQRQAANCQCLYASGHLEGSHYTWSVRLVPPGRLTPCMAAQTTTHHPAPKQDVSCKQQKHAGAKHRNYVPVQPCSHESPRSNQAHPFTNGMSHGRHCPFFKPAEHTIRHPTCSSKGTTAAARHGANAGCNSSVFAYRSPLPLVTTPIPNAEYPTIGQRYQLACIVLHRKANTHSCLHLKRPLPLPAQAHTAPVHNDATSRAQQTCSARSLLVATRNPQQCVCNNSPV